LEHYEQNGCIQYDPDGKQFSFLFFTFTLLPTATTRIILCDVRSVVWRISNDISEKKTADRMIKAASYPGTSLHIY